CTTPCPSTHTVSDPTDSPDVYMTGSRLRRVRVPPAGGRRTLSRAPPAPPVPAGREPGAGGRPPRRPPRATILGVLVHPERFVDPGRPAVDPVQDIHLPIHDALGPGIDMRRLRARGGRVVGEREAPVVPPERDVLRAVALGNTGRHHPVGEHGVAGRPG